MAYGIGGSLPEDLPRYLKDINFPARRMDILWAARQHHADPEMLEKLELIPDEEYGSLEEVVEEYRKPH
jgi:hypothetical protein